MKSKKIKKIESVEFYFDFYIWKKICHVAKEMNLTPDEVVEFFLTKWVQPT